MSCGLFCKALPQKQWAPKAMAVCKVPDKVMFFCTLNTLQGLGLIEPFGWNHFFPGWAMSLASVLLTPVWCWFWTLSTKYVQSLKRHLWVRWVGKKGGKITRQTIPVCFCFFQFLFHTACFQQAQLCSHARRFARQWFLLIQVTIIHIFLGGSR